MKRIHIYRDFAVLNRDTIAVEVPDDMDDDDIEEYKYDIFAVAYGGSASEREEMGIRYCGLVSEDEFVCDLDPDETDYGWTVAP